MTSSLYQTFLDIFDARDLSTSSGWKLVDLGSTSISIVLVCHMVIIVNVDPRRWGSRTQAPVPVHAGHSVLRALPLVVQLNHGVEVVTISLAFVQVRLECKMVVHRTALVELGSVGQELRRLLANAELVLLELQLQIKLF